MFNFFAEDMLTPLDTANRDTIDYEYLVSKLIANWSHERKKKNDCVSSSLMHFQSHMAKWSKPQIKMATTKKKHSSQMSEGILDDSIMHLMNPQNPSGNFHILLLFFVNYLTSCHPASQI